MKDPFAIEFLDDHEDYGEERFIIIGMADGEVLLFVAPSVYVSFQPGEQRSMSKNSTASKTPRPMTPAAVEHPWP